jgi:lipoprotein-releasing system ATP-binding protein
MESEAPGVLEVAGLGRSFPTPGGRLEVLEGIDLTLAPGRSLVVSGPSGSGKSTLLNLLGTLDRPTAGTVRLGGVDPFSLPAAGLARFRARRIGFVFQDHLLLPQLDARENVLAAAAALGPVGGAERERAAALLERLGLADRLDHLPGELSGGEQQRVALARALVNGPHLVLADEPTGNLDENTAQMIGELLAELVTGQGAMLVVATHDRELAARFPERRRLRGGRLHDG